MKILIITLEYPPQIGGIASYLLNMARYWPNKNDQLVFYAPKMAGDVEFDRKNNWPVYRFEPYFKLFWPKWLKMLWQVWKIVKKERPDKIYAHHVLPVGYVAYIFKKIKKIPYVLFFHGTDFGYAVSNQSKRARLSQVVCYAERIVTNSHYLQERVRMYFGHFDNDKKVVYPCPSLVDQPIETDKLTKFKQKYNPQNRPLFLTCARLVARKGQDMVIRSLPNIIEKIPNVLYLICGQGEYKSELVVLVEKLKLQEHVNFVDFVPLGDLSYLYSLADVFVMPSREEKDQNIEGFGIVLLEAGMFGKPVIAGHSGGVPEAVEDGFTGILVDPINTNEIAEVAIKLLTDKNLAKTMGANSQQRVIKEFRWEKQLKKLVV